MICLLINSNKISACLCHNDEATDTLPLEYLFLLLLFLFSAVLGLVIQIRPNRNFSFAIPGSLCKTKAACTGRQLRPDGQRFPLREFIQWVGFFILFLSNICIGDRDTTVASFQIFCWKKHFWCFYLGIKGQSLPCLLSIRCWLLSLWWMVTKNKSITSSDLLPNVPCLSVIWVQGLSKKRHSSLL